MGIRTALRLIEGGKAIAPGRPTTRQRYKSPFGVAALSRPVVADVWDGLVGNILTREAAMTIPPVVKARMILVSQIAPTPLRAYLDEEDANGDPVLAPEQPKWLYRTDGQVSPHHRMVWTLDDCLFSGWSLWGTPRDDSGAIEFANRIPIEWWNFDADGNIVVNDEVMDESEVILIPGPSEGFLEYAARSMSGAVELESAWIKRAKQIIPLVELHELVDNTVDEEDAIAVVKDYLAARADEDGAVVFTPASIQMNVHADKTTDVGIEARNFVKVDVANFTGLPAEALDGSLSTASLTYSTQEGTRNEILDYPLAYWSDPIAARFSQDDVIEAGKRIRFDFKHLRTVTPSPTGPNVKD